MRSRSQKKSTSDGDAIPQTAATVGDTFDVAHFGAANVCLCAAAIIFLKDLLPRKKTRVVMPTVLPLFCQVLPCSRISRLVIATRLEVTRL